MDDGLRNSVVVDWKHLQHKRHKAIRTRSIFQLLRVSARGAFVKTILLVGGAGADSGADRIGRTVQHGKVQRDDTITTRNRLQMDGIETFRVIRVARKSVGISLDDGLRNCVIVGWKHLQHERHKAIRTRNTLQPLRVSARGAFVKSILLVGGAGANGGTDGIGRTAQNGKVQRNDTIATRNRLQAGGIESLRVIRVAREGVGVSLDNGLRNCVVVDWKHLQHERHKAIRTRGTLQLLRVGARSAFVKTILLVRSA